MTEKKVLKKCNLKCDVYSRVVGYYTPVRGWNKGKKEEFSKRKNFDLDKAPDSFNNSKNAEDTNETDK